MKTKNNYSEKSGAKILGQRKGHGNPSNLHASRKGSTVKKPVSSSREQMGLSIGQKVPMKMFQSAYTKPDYHGMPRIDNANNYVRGTKKALGGKQKKFFGI